MATKVKKSTGNKKHHLVGETFNDGESIPLLAEAHGVKEVTILAHLKTFIDEGNDLRLEGLLEFTTLSQRQQDHVMAAFKKKGPLMLRPVYDELNKAIGYDELRIMQLYYMATNK